MGEWIKLCAADKPQCVQVRETPEGVEVRDSKLGDDSPVLQFTHDEWAEFDAGIKAGKFQPGLVAA